MDSAPEGLTTFLHLLVSPSRSLPPPQTPDSPPHSRILCFLYICIWSSVSPCPSHPPAVVKKKTRTQLLALVGNPSPQTTGVHLGYRETLWTRVITDLRLGKGPEERTSSLCLCVQRPSLEMSCFLLFLSFTLAKNSFRSGITLPQSPMPRSHAPLPSSHHLFKKIGVSRLTVPMGSDVNTNTNNFYSFFWQLNPMKRESTTDSISNPNRLPGHLMRSGQSSNMRTIPSH